MNKHTPGEWYAPSAGVWTSEGVMIADCGTSDVVSTMAEHGRDPLSDIPANVRLIAAAPQLLEACIQARAALPDAWSAVDCGVPVVVVELLNKAIAAAAGYSAPIKKATGWSYLQNGYHQFFTKDEWGSDVANDNTQLGYEEWVKQNLESLLYSTDLEGVDAIEVAGCTETEGYVEVCDEEDAEFFSVYTHKPNQGVECICDFNTKGHAVDFAVSMAARINIPVYGNMCSVEASP